MLKVVLVDDEANSMEVLNELLSLYHPDLTICSYCRTVSSAVSTIRTHEPDVVFLDVELGSETGFDLFKHFPNPSFKVIFTTAHEHYAVHAFRFAALDYLLKPVHPDLLAEALKKASEVIDREQMSVKIDSFLHNINGASRTNKKIVLKTAESIYLVELSEIMYCAADRGYTNFYLADKSRIMVSNTMGDYEELFSDYNFLRIHQSYLLNLSYFKRYEKADGGKAVLKNEMSLPVATRKKELLLQRLAQL